MKRMTYMSNFARPLSCDEIDALAAHAVVRNTADGITGVLLTLGSVFFQIIEGPEASIDDLYERVLVDDRHTDIVWLSTEINVDSRLFPDWSMNSIGLDAAGGGVIEPLKLLLGRMGDAQHIIERYTQPAVSRILRQGLDPLSVPLRTLDRVVLFTDMVSFSALSELLPVEQVGELVSTYLEVCSTAIDRNGGEVTKFLGDGVMAYFDADRGDDALASCVEMQRELANVRASAPEHSALQAVFSGYGLALGPVLEGSVGSSVKMDYTIIGEPVNTAAKLEALTRTLDASVLMTGAVASATRREWDVRSVGRFDIGREAAVEVHSLAGLQGCGDARTIVAERLDLLRRSRLGTPSRVSSRNR